LRVEPVLEAQPGAELVEHEREGGPLVTAGPAVALNGPVDEQELVLVPQGVVQEGGAEVSDLNPDLLGDAERGVGIDDPGGVGVADPPEVPEAAVIGTLEGHVDVEVAQRAVEVHADAVDGEAAEVVAAHGDVARIGVAGLHPAIQREAGTALSHAAGERLDLPIQRHPVFAVLGEAERASRRDGQRA